MEDDDITPRRRNPLVLVGAATTAGVLAAGLLAFKQGNSALSQKMMRARVIAQGLTVGLMVATSVPWFLSKDNAEHKPAHSLE